jgi:hypothetical protein
MQGARKLRNKENWDYKAESESGFRILQNPCNTQKGTLAATTHAAMNGPRLVPNSGPAKDDNISEWTGSNSVGKEDK